jgi:glycosyltransferase involved in cell wall biosynthesis
MSYKSQTVSAIVITHNDAATLEEALYSLRWVDELIVLDQGSTDGTLNIARTFTDKVFFHPSKNLTVLRRDALSLGKSDWLLLVEPDEWVEEMLKHEIDGILLNNLPNVNGFTIPRKLKFQNEWVNVISDVEPQRDLRLVRKGRWKISDDWLATLSVDGEVRPLDRPLGYAPYRTVEELFARVNQRSTLAAYKHLETQGFSNVPQSAWGIWWQSKVAMLKGLFLKGGIRAGFSGLTMSVAYALETFLRLAKIRMLLARKA